MGGPQTRGFRSLLKVAQAASLVARLFLLGLAPPPGTRPQQEKTRHQLGNRGHFQESRENHLFGDRPIYLCINASTRSLSGHLPR